MRPVRHHGVNPAIAHLSGQAQRAIVKAESKARSCGDWGIWEKVNNREISAMIGDRAGWIRDVRHAYRNKVFSVMERLDCTGVIHAGISSLSGIRPSWYEMQRIKDELFGEGTTAVEIYPPRKEIVDGSDMFHLWILPGEINFGLTRLGPTRGAAGPAAELLVTRTKS